MFRKIILVLLMAMPAVVAKTAIVPENTARRVAESFYFERLSQFRTIDVAAVGITGINTVVIAGRPVYYIFNMEPAGYVIVSASDAVIPVLAYSFDGVYRQENAPPQFTAWMKQYEDQIIAAVDGMMTGDANVQALWKKYDRNIAVFSKEESTGIKPANEGGTGNTWNGATSHAEAGKEKRGFVAPLIYSNWNQNAPYNEQCPPDPAGPGGHTYAGCVPVCMGQLMYYYRWPKSGTGSYSYTDPKYGTLSADFGNTTYDWDNMTNTITASNPGISLLLYHLGVSCDLVYGPDGSGMYNHKAAYSLRTYFKYSPETQYVYRDSTNLDWDSILIAHLDRKMPMYYAGWSVPNINGHAFVCDGYQDTAYFHFNFGWSGQNNGYFYTNNLIVGGNNFNLAQEVIINAFPDTVNYQYPEYCAGMKSLTYNAGSLTDGSGPANPCQPGADCSWLIDPQTSSDSVTSITLTFNQVNLSNGDLLRIWDGGSESAPLLASFNADTLPAPITGTSNRMFIRFTSASGSTGQGWYATYKTKAPVWCTGTQSITADTLVLTNGSMGFNYQNNTVCRWKIQSKSGLPLTLHFRKFDTEPDRDYLKIYDQADGSLLADLSGHYTAGGLPDSVTAQSGKVLLIFMTNNSVTAKGWEIYYPRQTTGVPADPAGNLTVFPNPASGLLYLTMPPGSGYSHYTLHDCLGTARRSGNLPTVKTGEPVVIHVEGLSKGLYFLRAYSPTGNLTRKIIVE